MTQTRLVEVRQNVLKHNEVLARELAREYSSRAFSMRVFEVSLKTGAGMDEWLEFLRLYFVARAEV